MHRSIRKVLNAYLNGAGDLVIVQTYHEALVMVGADEATAWLSSTVLDAIDTAEENLIHAGR